MNGNRTFKDGIACDHPGCLNHTIHSCEGCGRMMGRSFVSDEERYKFIEQDLKKTWSARGNDWNEFSFDVFRHVENYTVPQYGDKPNDQIENWTVEDCLRQVSKRIARYGKNVRPGQQMLDFLKMVHEIQIAALKWAETEKSVEMEVVNTIKSYEND